MGSDSDDEDDFVTYGTPLEPLEEDAIPKKKAVTIEDQVAKDKHGRRRFHGAFTGGFSAGFFNTAGSLEGWKPTQFKSSRSSRLTSQLQKPEDFMDDEDMEEFGIAPKILRPTGDYDQVASRKRPLREQVSDGPIPGVPVLRTLIEPVRETIGIKLLVKMGWKSGQGVGPRLTKFEKSAVKRTQKVYGCTLPGQSEQCAVDDDEEEEELSDVTFAPDDYEPYIVKPKDNCFGLGYSGLDRRSVLSSHIDLFGSSLVMEEKKKKVSIRGQAFGVGAFEKEDEDIYANEDMSQYDFALDTPKMMAEKRAQERYSRNTTTVGSSTSSDILEGFELCRKPVVRKAYPPPPLPQGFRPVHQSQHSRFSGGDQKAVTRQRLTAEERAVLVGDTPPQGDRTTKDDPPPVDRTTRADPSPVDQTTKDYPPPQVERTTSGTFRPFAGDEDKQQRYEQYLTLSKLGQKDGLRRLQPLSMTDWEAEREKVEFEQAARLYRPLSAAFSDRFVSASQSESTDPLEPVARTVTADSDVRGAAKLNMYGRLTRRVGEWSPHNTLCKRFNIPPPRCGSSGPVTKKTRPKFSVFNFLDAAQFNSASESKNNNSEEHQEIHPPSITTEADIDSYKIHSSPTRAESDETKTTKDDIDNLVETTNKMDLYKAIFLSSSDESEGEDSTEVDKRPEEINVLRNTSPPRGIFACLDRLQDRRTSTKPEDKRSEEVKKNTSPQGGIFANLDRPQDKRSSATPLDTTSVSSEKVKEQSESHKKQEQTDSEESPQSVVYGPPLPEAFNVLNRTSKDTSKASDSDDEWVEQNDSDSDKSHRHSSKKKHSKKSHRKSKKHKHKHKKKKK